MSEYISRSITIVVYAHGFGAFLFGVQISNFDFKSKVDPVMFS